MYFQLKRFNAVLSKSLLLIKVQQFVRLQRADRLLRQVSQLRCRKRCRDSRRHSPELQVRRSGKVATMKR